MKCFVHAVCDEIISFVGCLECVLNRGVLTFY